MQADDPDRPLVEKAQQQLPYGTSAYDELVRKYSSLVYARSYSILRSAADAEEASQDVFLAIFRSLPRYRFERPFSHWLSTVTLNACRMILRGRANEQRRRDAYQREPVAPAPEPSSDVALRGLIVELLDQLEPATRVVLIMRFIEDRSHAEIAEALQISESAAKMRLSRGAKRLRALYEERTANPPHSESNGG